MQIFKFPIFMTPVVHYISSAPNYYYYLLNLINYLNLHFWMGMSTIWKSDNSMRVAHFKITQLIMELQFHKSSTCRNLIDYLCGAKWKYNSIRVTHLGIYEQLNSQFLFIPIVLIRINNSNGIVYSNCFNHCKQKSQMGHYNGIVTPFNVRDGSSVWKRGLDGTGK